MFQFGEDGNKSGITRSSDSFVGAIDIVQSQQLQAEVDEDGYNSSPITVNKFVTTLDTNFILNGKIWIPFGASVYGYYSHSDFDNRVIAAKAAHLNILRIVNQFGPSYPSSPGYEFTESIWQQIDYALAAFRNAGIKALLSLDDIQGISDARGYTFGDVNNLNLWKSVVTFLSQRVNTVNGIKYIDDETIAIIAIAGDPGNVADLYNNYNTIGGYLKNSGFKQLITTGSLKPEQIVDASFGFNNYIGSDILSAPNIDCACTAPYYAQSDMARLFPDLQIYVEKRSKPWFIIEFGYIDTDINRAAEYTFVYTTGKTYKSAGFLFWNFDDSIGNYGVSPNTSLVYAVVQQFGLLFG